MATSSTGSMLSFIVDLDLDEIVVVDEGVVFGVDVEIDLLQGAQNP